jgi:DnaJ family protein C protein 9
MVKLQPGQSLYEALGIEKTAEASEIRKAYLKFAVQLHPDKNPDDEEAKERFQTLQKIYSVLSDPEKYVHRNLIIDASCHLNIC